MPVQHRDIIFSHVTYGSKVHAIFPSQMSIIALAFGVRRSDRNTTRKETSHPENSQTSINVCKRNIRRLMTMFHEEHIVYILHVGTGPLCHLCFVIWFIICNLHINCVLCEWWLPLVSGLKMKKKIEWARKPLLFILWSWTIKVSVKGS